MSSELAIDLLLKGVLALLTIEMLLDRILFWILSVCNYHDNVWVSASRFVCSILHHILISAVLTCNKFCVLPHFKTAQVCFIFGIFAPSASACRFTPNYLEPCNFLLMVKNPSGLLLF